ncbi:MupG family TIM beta-alpha barrel fold protein [Megasphaera vaginalis (ex Bordigoni et al. 2020)]|uniref:MupG family TIM beta-alpha barrel fold protein n=1 Tax=Megasphaera vaginalis (ex Bordigoni et al. 2020) TaxID=2045301 RepID=UPI000C7B2371|nr:MupG family TIM beta-alpha barrel fold protein [Megasphaera vaginalis (ex Bordigoni et al. 2020)]
MRTGLSLYPGLDSTATLEKTLSLACTYGIDRLFLSLHIPEADTTKLRCDLQKILRRARENRLDVIADISPETAAFLGFDEVTPQALLACGITTARLDAGFTPAQTTYFSKCMTVQLNASTIREDDLLALRAAGADFSHIDSLHNFYPRPFTGLSPAFTAQQTALLHRYGIHVGAFIAGMNTKRAPLYEGLPTVEDHRSWETLRAVRHLSALQLDTVFIGDSAPTAEEVNTLGNVAPMDADTVVLRIQMHSDAPHLRRLLQRTFTLRPDRSAYVLRTAGCRALTGDIPILPAGPRRRRQRGDITIDNQGFGRYMGEVEIVLTDLPVEERTNIVASVLAEDLPLLDAAPYKKKIIFQWQH